MSVQRRQPSALLRLGFAHFIPRAAGGRELESCPNFEFPLVARLSNLPEALRHQSHLRLRRVSLCFDGSDLRLPGNLLLLYRGAEVALGEPHRLVRSASNSFRVLDLKPEPSNLVLISATMQGTKIVLFV